MQFLRQKLSDFLEHPVTLGNYWIYDDGNDSRPYFGVHFRCRSGFKPLRNQFDSDHIEGVLTFQDSANCLSAQASLVPFLQNMPIQRNSPIRHVQSPGQTDSNSQSHVEDLFICNYENDKFTTLDWEPGYFDEWAYIKKPGDFYYALLEIELTKIHFTYGEPVLCEFQTSHLQKVLANAVARKHARISLIHINRDRSGKNLVPIDTKVSEGSNRFIHIKDCLQLAPDRLQFDLRKIAIRGGWKPGQYYFALREQNFHEPGTWAFHSEITKPLKITIRRP